MDVTQDKTQNGWRNKSTHRLTLNWQFGSAIQLPIGSAIGSAIESAIQLAPPGQDLPPLEHGMSLSRLQGNKDQESKTNPV